MLLEPRPMSQGDRYALAQQVFQRVLAGHGNQVLAIGLYGSLARGTDQPYSDIEMKCVLKSDGEDYSQEWVENGGKIEVNFESEDVILSEAAMVDEDWAITHGAYFDLKPLYGDSSFFDRLRAALHSPGQNAFDAAICEVIVGNVFEAMGKLRNSCLVGNTQYLPELACEIAYQGALAIGLAHRKCYSTRARVLSESLVFDNRPNGYERLCQLVMDGQLNAADEIAAALEEFWVGLVNWANKNHVPLERRCSAPL